MRLNRLLLAATLALPLLAGCAHTYERDWVAPGYDAGKSGLVAVLPLENHTAYPNAGETVSELLATELRVRGFDVLDGHEVRRRLGLNPDDEGVRGSLSFIGRDFELVHSRVSFLGGPEIDPTLDVVFQHERTEITGRIAVRGRASDPQLAFESEPALPEDEVLPRVIFGSSRQSLSAAEGIQLASGVATLASGGEGAIGRVRSAVGLDVLAVDTGSESTSLRAGQNVADGVFVGVKQPIDGGSTAVQVEVEVFDNVTVDAETGAEEGSSLGVNWKYDW